MLTHCWGGNIFYCFDEADDKQFESEQWPTSRIFAIYALNVFLVNKPLRNQWTALKWSFFKWLISSSAFPLYQISGSFKAEAQTTFLSQNLSFLFFYLKFQLQLLDLGSPWNLNTNYLPKDFQFLTMTQKIKLGLKMIIISTCIL